mmetsp:Transcript_146103/g.266256  ORF Transcript_146103/g.266256 Transcript_146103/m.266256 type:complete len:267 (+) Transcript_146103:448-1248(+)
MPPRRRWCWPGELEVCCLVPSIDATLPFAAILLCEPDELVQWRFHIVFSLQKCRLRVDGDGVLDVLNKFRKVGDVEPLHIEGLLVVLVVVEGEVRLREPRTVWIVEVFFESMHEQVELIAQTKKHPVLIHKVCKQRLATANIQNVLDRIHVRLLLRIFLIVFLCLFLVLLFLLFLFLLLILVFLLSSLFTILLLVGLLFLLFLLFFFFLLFRTFAPGFLSVRARKLPPILKHLSPFCMLLNKPIGRLQILCPLRLFQLHDPFLHMS